MASQRDYQPPELLSMEASRVVQLKLGDAHTEPPILAYGLPATWQHNACTTILPLIVVTFMLLSACLVLEVSASTTAD